MRRRLAAAAVLVVGVLALTTGSALPAQAGSSHHPVRVVHTEMRCHTVMDPSM